MTFTTHEPLPLPRMADRHVGRRFLHVLLDRDGRAWRPADAIRDARGKLRRAGPWAFTHRVFLCADGEQRVAEMESGEVRHWDAPRLQAQLDRARVVRQRRAGGGA